MSENYRIGQLIKITEDFEIETIGGRKFEVKKGDSGYLDSQGYIHFTSGKANRLIQNANANMEGYDHANIAKIIIEKALSNYGIDEFLEGYEIDKDELIDSISNVLTDIL